MSVIACCASFRPEAGKTTVERRESGLQVGLEVWGGLTKEEVTKGCRSSRHSIFSTQHHPDSSQHLYRYMYNMEMGF